MASSPVRPPVQALRSPRFLRPLRWTLAILALAGAATSLLSHRGRAAEVRQVTARLAEAWGQPPGDLAAELAREGDPERARIRAARALLAGELDPARREPPAEAGADPAALSAERMARGADLAAEALAARPAAWDAAMLLGATTYLGRSQARDPRLLSRHRDWEAPLTAALALAPSKDEPARFLAAAYLEIWPFLSPAKRAAAGAVLAAAFRDLDTFARLSGAWFEVAPDRDTAFALVPDDPAAWERLQDLFAQRQNWAALAAARQRGRRALGSRLTAQLAEAEARLAGGDSRGSRELFLEVASRAEPGARGGVLIARALDQCPPGPVDRETAARLAVRLSWALDRCLVGHCPLPPAALRRLARFCRDLESSERALAALLAGDLSEAERIERHAEAQWREDWAPYLLIKARRLAEQGRADEAVAGLARVHRSRHGTPLYWQVRREVALASSDPRGEQEAAGRLRQLARESWPATAWTWQRGRARLELLTRRPAEGLRLRFDVAPEQGALVEVWLDGENLGSVPAAAGGTAVVPAGTAGAAGVIAPGLHLLDVRSVAGGAVLPGAVTLLGAVGGTGGGTGGDQPVVARVAGPLGGGGGAGEHGQAEGVGRQGEAEVEGLVDRDRGEHP